MKLFFSYGHDQNAEIVERIKKDIEARRDVKVYIDTEFNNRGGIDWRRNITEKIMDSDIMVAFASKHSVRDPGVCLDELTIAVCVKGALVQSVLLEKNVTPPNNVGYKEYIDMSDWRNMIDRPDFEEWYEEKLQKIIDAVSSKKIRRYADEIEYLRNVLCPDLSSIKKDRLKNEVYCERDWLSEKVQKWIEDENAPHIMLIDGPPGTGKSSFMAHEFMFNASVGAIIFCEWDNPNFNNMDVISRNLIFHLATRYPDYRQQVLAYLKEENDRQKNEGGALRIGGRDLFKQLVVNRLRNLINGDRPMLLILIDGADELQDDSGSGRKKNVLAELLQDEVKNLPEWVRFVVTSRPDAKVIRPLEDAYVVHLDEEANRNDDVRRYLEYELCDKNTNRYNDKVLNKLTELCSGNFLFAKIACDALKKNVISLEDIKNGQQIDGSLASIYRKYFDRTFTDIKEYEERFYMPLAALVISKEPIPQETLRCISGGNAAQMVNILNTLSPYLVETDGKLSLYHKSLKDWLSDEKADAYVIDNRDGCIAVANACYESYDRAYNRYAGHMNQYEMRYLIPYMKETSDHRLEEILHNKHFADDLLVKADEMKNKYNYVAACEFAEMAVEIYRGINDKVNEVETYQTLAEINNMSVQLKQAAWWCQQGIDAAKKVYNCRDSYSYDEYNRIITAYGNIKLHLAYIYYRENKWDESIAVYDDASTIFIEIGDYENYIYSLLMKANELRLSDRIIDSLKCYDLIKNTPVYGELKKKNPNLYLQMMTYYGWSLYNAGKFKEAEEKLDEVEKMVDKKEGYLSRKDIGQMYYLRGVLLYNAGDYENCIKYCETAQACLCKVYGEDTVEICSALNQEGAARKKQGQIKEAVRLFKRSYHIRYNAYGDENIFTTIAKRNYAMALLEAEENGDNNLKENESDESNIEEVEKMLQDILDIRKRICSDIKGASWLAQIYQDIACLEEVQKNYTDALKKIDRAECLYDKCGKEVSIATCEYIKGRILESKECWSDAKTAFENAISTRRKYYSENHPYIREIEEHIKRISF